MAGPMRGCAPLVTSCMRPACVTFAKSADRMFWHIPSRVDNMAESKMPRLQGVTG